MQVHIRRTAQMTDAVVRQFPAPPPTEGVGITDGNVECLFLGPFGQGWC
jgi:hypothetical protein